jgi:hypothetical protein
MLKIILNAIFLYVTQFFNENSFLVKAIFQCKQIFNASSFFIKNSLFNASNFLMQVVFQCKQFF